MVDCERFLDQYSEFRDGFLLPEESREFEAHLKACASCARYDRVVSRGTGIFRDLPELEVSEDFGARLQHRIFNLEDEMRASRQGGFSGVPASAALSIAAVLAVTAWLPVLRPGDGLPRLPAVAAHAPESGIPPLFVAGPLLAHAALLHRDPEAAVRPARDNHLLFRYYPGGAPVGYPVALQVALAD
ncbi:MAG TPA: zf-HC2 domain-containing protein [Longimicrobiaceae bacterium]